MFFLGPFSISLTSFLPLFLLLTLMLALGLPLPGAPIFPSSFLASAWFRPQPKGYVTEAPWTSLLSFFPLNSLSTSLPNLIFIVFITHWSNRLHLCVSSDSPISPSKPPEDRHVVLPPEITEDNGWHGELTQQKTCCVHTCVIFLHFSMSTFFFFQKRKWAIPFPFYPSWFIFLLFSLPSLHFSSQNVCSILGVSCKHIEILIHSIIVMIGRKVFHLLYCNFKA